MELLSFSRILSKDSYYKHEVRLLDVDENGLHRKIWKLTGGKKLTAGAMEAQDEVDTASA